MTAARPPLPPLPRAFGAGMAEATRRAVRQALPGGGRWAGRSPRGEFWLFVVVVKLVEWTITLVHGALFGPRLEQTFDYEFGPVTERVYDGGWPGTLWSLAVVLPLIGVSVRRLHDRDQSGWWLPGSVLWFIAIIWLYVTLVRPPFQLSPTASTALLALALAIVIPLNLFIHTLRRGTPGPNRFGPDPLEVRP